MSRKTTNIVMCISSLLLGGSLYLIFRKNVYITVFIENFIKLDRVRETLLFYDCRLLRNHIPDFLWALGLNSGLNSISPKTILNASITFTCGAAWEILQSVSLVNGTADAVDILMYLTATILAVTINKYLFKENEK